MKKFALTIAGCLLLAACQTQKPLDQMTNDEAIASEEQLAAKGKASDTKFPVKTATGLYFGGKRAIPDDCRVPPEGRQKGKPLTRATIDAWPPQLTSDVAILQAALAGVAYPEEVTYIQGCMEAKVTGAQTPGPMPVAMAAPAVAPVPATAPVAPSGQIPAQP